MGDSLALFAASRTTSRYLHQPHNGDYGPNSFQHGKGKHAFVLCEECAGCSQYTPHQVQKLVVDGGAARVALKMGWQEGPSRGKIEPITTFDVSSMRGIWATTSRRHERVTPSPSSSSPSPLLSSTFLLKRTRGDGEKKKKTQKNADPPGQNTTKKQAALRLCVCVGGCFNG